ncbi:MAG: hypothetical protein HYU99_07540 [Deltaproteobacteria bacterium]|nr:hypothetical protein [Deltaproteobacteria bacterium]
MCVVDTGAASFKKFKKRFCSAFSRFAKTPDYGATYVKDPKNNDIVNLYNLLAHPKMFTVNILTKSAEFTEYLKRTFKEGETLFIDGAFQADEKEYTRVRIAFPKENLTDDHRAQLGKFYNGMMFHKNKNGVKEAWDDGKVLENYGVDRMNLFLFAKNILGLESASSGEPSSGEPSWTHVGLDTETKNDVEFAVRPDGKEVSVLPSASLYTAGEALVDHPSTTEQLNEVYERLKTKHGAFKADCLVTVTPFRNGHVGVDTVIVEVEQNGETVINRALNKDIDAELSSILTALPWPLKKEGAYYTHLVEVKFPLSEGGINQDLSAPL